MAIHFSFAFPKASECCVIYVAARSHRFVKRDFTWEDCNSRVEIFRRQNLQQTSVLPPEVLLTCSSCGRVLGTTTLFATVLWRVEAAENIPGLGPREGLLPGSWCCSLRCNLSSLYLGSKNFHLDSKIRRDICVGMMVPPTQASSAT